MRELTSFAEALDGYSEDQREALLEEARATYDQDRGEALINAAFGELDLLGELGGASWAHGLG